MTGCVPVWESGLALVCPEAAEGKTLREAENLGCLRSWRGMETGIHTYIYIKKILKKIYIYIKYDRWRKPNHK